MMESKLDPTKSRFAKKQIAKSSFEETVKGTHSKSEEYKIRAVELSQKYLKMVGTKVLPTNKGPLEQSLERETIKELIDLSVEINNVPIPNGIDPENPEQLTFLEGMGSAGNIALLLKCVLILRDQLAEAEYRLDKKTQALQELLDQKNSTPSSSLV